MIGLGRFISVLIALLFIFVGVVLLLGNLGFLAVDPFVLIGQLWPVLLILLGLYFIWLRIRPAPAFTTVAVAEAISGASRGDITIDFGAGELRMYPLASAEKLFDGTFALRPRVVVDRAGGSIRAKLNQGEWPHVSPFSTGRADRWDIGLTTQIPLSVHLNTGASRVSVDLTDNRLDLLELNTGASDVTMRLPRSSGATRVLVKGGATSIRLEIPQGVAAHILSKGALGSLSVDQRRFPRQGDVYVSADYETAQNKVEIRVETGVSSITIV